MKEIQTGEIIKLASQMIEIPSVTENHDANRQVLDLVDEYIGSDNSVVSRTFEKNGVSSRLWGSPNSLMTPKLLLCGHVDVVDAEGNNSLFSPKVIDKKLMGRGSGDMKGFCASKIIAFKRWVEERNGADNLGLLLTTDEEKGGFNGARHVVEQGLSPNIVFVADGAFDFNIIQSQKAPHHFIVEARGNGGHASRAFEIENPVNRLIKMYDEVRKEFSIATVQNPWSSTFEMTVINTENRSKNKIPDNVVAAFSWRWPVEQIVFEEGRARIFEIINRCNCAVIEEEGFGEGCYTEPKSKYVQDWKTIIENVIGKEVGFQNTHGASDIRHFYNAKEGGTKNTILTSGITGNHHESTEWVNVDSLVQLTDALYRYQDVIISSQFG